MRFTQSQILKTVQNVGRRNFQAYNEPNELVTCVHCTKSIVKLKLQKHISIVPLRNIMFAFLF